MIDITLDDDEATFENTHYDGSSDAKTCPYNVTGAYEGDPVVDANGTRTYEVELQVSAVTASGTENKLYLRLCTDQYSTDCTRSCNGTDCVDDWYVFEDSETGDSYTVSWNTDDIGNVSYADIVIFGDDQFCISDLIVDGVDADASYDCISADTEDGEYGVFLFYMFFVHGFGLNVQG